MTDNLNLYYGTIVTVKERPGCRYMINSEPTPIKGAKGQRVRYWAMLRKKKGEVFDHQKVYSDLIYEVIDEVKENDVDEAVKRFHKWRENLVIRK